MATKKISELEAITEADGSDVLAIVDVSEGKTNKITKNNLLIGAGHSIEMSLNQETYALTLILKNAAGTELNTASIDLPNENSITDISYNNGKLTLTKQSGTTTEVDITGLIEGLVTESDFNTFTTALQETIGAINVKNEQQDLAIENNYKVITKLQEDVEDLTERVEDAENNEMTYTPTPATSHYLQDSADSRFRKFIPIGRTTQESTTGKNLAEPGIERTVNGVTFKNNTDGSTTLTGTSTASAYNAVGRRTLPAGTYYCYVSRTSTSSNISYYLWDSDYQTIGQINQPFTLSEEKKVLIICGIENAGVAVNETVKAQIEPGNVFTGWEPYTGGEPAPNPKYPIAIKNTGDNGSVNEKVQNKNFLANLVASANTTVTNGVVTQTSADTRSDLQWKIQTYNGTTKVEELPLIVKNTIGMFSRTFTKNSTFNRIRFGLNGSQKDTLVISDVSDLPDGEYTLSYNITNVTQGSISWQDVMITKVTETDLSYVPHSEQNISFPLVQGQKLYEGDYLADDGVHHVRGEVDLSTLTWSEYDTNKYTSSIIENIKIPETTSIKANVLAEKYIAKAQSATFVNGNIAVSASKRFIVFDKTGAPSGICQYELAQEVIEPYTEEQQTAWEEIKKARTYKNVTHISSEDETPANVEIEYVRDINTIDDRITALEAKVNLLEE